MQKLSKIWYSLIAGLATLFFIAGIPMISHAEETTFTAEEIKTFLSMQKLLFQWISIQARFYMTKREKPRWASPQ